MELNLKDLKILRILDQNVRASYKQIGKKTRLNKEVVQYRIKKLEEEQIIKGYWTLINFGFGFVYKILIKNKNLAKEKKQEFIEYVKNQKMVSWFASTEGNFDFIMTIYAKNDHELVTFSNDIFQKYGKYFQEKHLLKSISVNITNDKYLYPNNKFIYNYKISLLSGKIPKNKIDEEILTSLSLNARSSFTEIGKKVNLTPEAVAYRIKKIKEEGFITGFKTRLNFEKIGLSYYHLFISLQNQESKKTILSYYKLYSHCNSTMEHLGYYDLHLEFILPNEKIQETIDDFMLKFGDSVTSYELIRIREEHLINILR